MLKSIIPIFRTITCVFVASIVAMPSAYAAELKDSQELVSQINQEAAESQQTIDRLAGETQALLEEYRRIQSSADYQLAYTVELQQLEEAQNTRIGELRQQIEEAGITQQRIVPLMRSMADALEKFVVLDLPFHHEERINAVLQMKQRLQQPDLSLPVKFRLLLETWQLEQDYGTTIEAWRGPLDNAEQVLSVEFLRVGRVALYYQSLDGLNCGYWDKPKQTWVDLADEFNQDITKALRVARNQVAPELLRLPLATGDVR